MLSTSDDWNPEVLARRIVKGAEMLFPVEKDVMTPERQEAHDRLDNLADCYAIATKNPSRVWDLYEEKEVCNV